jgi:hypothetical protein
MRACGSAPGRRGNQPQQPSKDGKKSIIKYKAICDDVLAWGLCIFFLFLPPCSAVLIGGCLYVAVVYVHTYSRQSNDFQRTYSLALLSVYLHTILPAFLPFYILRKLSFSSEPHFSHFYFLGQTIDFALAPRFSSV